MKNEYDRLVDVVVVVVVVVDVVVVVVVAVAEIWRCPVKNELRAFFSAIRFRRREVASSFSRQTTRLCNRATPNRFHAFPPLIAVREKFK